MLDAWCIAEGRVFVLAEDRAATRRLLTELEHERAARRAAEERIEKLTRGG